MIDPVLKDRIDSAGTVAFDVFDTLLVRPFFRPEHLFDYIECVRKADGFARARVRAERDARRSVRSEVNLDEIYSLLVPGFQDLKYFEIECELSLCRADPLAKEVWNYCLEQGKPVLVLSDMYLSSEVIGRMLGKCGFTGFTDLLVSSEHRVGKCTGELYGIVNAADCLMIGDNQKSDVSKARESGWDACRWIPMKERYASGHPHEVKFASKGWQQSLITGVDMFLWADAQREDYWHSVGLRFGGPLCTMYGLFVKENTGDSDCLFFLSRDGFMAKKAYEMLGGEIPTKYVYSSRFLKELYGADTPRKESYALFCEQCRLSGEDPAERFESGRSHYQKYLENCAGAHRKITVVDSTTLEFTSQKHLESVLGDRIAGGCYYSVIRNKRENVCYADRSREIISWTPVNLSEFLMSSNEAPIWDIDADGSPCYMSNGSEHEEYRRSVMEDIHEGEFDYLGHFMELFDIGMPIVSSKAIDQWLKVLVKTESVDDAHHIRGMKWPADMTNTKFVDMVWRPRDLGYSMVTMAGSVLKRLGLRR